MLKPPEKADACALRMGIRLFRGIFYYLNIRLNIRMA